MATASFPLDAVISNEELSSMQFLAGGLANTPPERVLIVDDDPDALEVLAAILRSMGHHVRTACDGAGALEAAEMQRPDIVLLDIELPGINGYEVARAIREMLGSAVRIVAVTGCDQHVTRPLDASVLKGLTR